MFIDNATVYLDNVLVKMFDGENANQYLRHAIEMSRGHEKKNIIQPHMS